MKSTKNDKKHNRSESIEGESKKSKTDNSKRKFAEFIENDSGHDHRIKKKKLNESHESNGKNNSMNKHDHDFDTSVLDDDDKETNKKKRLNKSLNDSGKNLTVNR